MADFEELRRRFEAGNESALYQAADACRRPNAETVALPCWVLEALVERLVKYMMELAPGPGGCQSTWSAQHQMDFVHVVRISEVARALQQQRRDHPGKRLNRSAARRHVADELKGTPYYGSPEAIKASIRLIHELRKNDPEEYQRRFWFGDQGLVLGKE